MNCIKYVKKIVKLKHQNLLLLTSKEIIKNNISEEKHFFPSTPLSLENLMTKILLDYNKYK
jgi:hypothetical protein